MVTDIERQINSRNTAETLLALGQTMKQADFVWIMGADSFANLHQWHHWTDIAEALPLAFLARPGYSIRALGGRAALRYAASASRPARLPSLSRKSHRPGFSSPCHCGPKAPRRFET